MTKSLGRNDKKKKQNSNNILGLGIRVKKGPWTPEEDRKLLSYIQQYGHGSWRSLPAKAGLKRCGKSCRLRWMNYHLNISTTFTKLLQHFPHTKMGPFDEFKYTNDANFITSDPLRSPKFWEEFVDVLDGGWNSLTSNFALMASPPTSPVF